MANDWDRVARKVSKLSTDLGREGRRQRLQLIGDLASDIANRSLEADIGDRSLSHWPRSNPVDMSIKGFLDVDGGAVEVKPVKRQAAGPWRVRESGRKAYEVGDRRQSGTRLRKKTGERVAKMRVVKRKTGAAGGHQTWSKAVTEMAQRIPEAAHKDVQEALRRQFGEG